MNDLKLILSPNKASIQTRQDEQTNSSSSSNSSTGNSTNESSSIEEHPSVVEDNSENNQNNETINCNSNKGQDVQSDGELVKEETTAIKTSADNPFNSIEFLSNYSAIQTSIRNTFGYIRINQNFNQSNKSNGSTATTTSLSSSSASSNNSNCNSTAQNLNSYNFFKSNYQQQQYESTQSLLNLNDAAVSNKSNLNMQERTCNFANNKSTSSAPITSLFCSAATVDSSCHWKMSNLNWPSKT